MQIKKKNKILYQSSLYVMIILGEIMKLQKEIIILVLFIPTFFILSFFVIILHQFIGTKLFFNNITEYSDNIKVHSTYYNEVLKNYEDYEAFINKRVNEDRRSNYLESGRITPEMFEKYDFLTYMYTSGICTEENSYPLSTRALKNKLYLKVIENENPGECVMHAEYSYIFPVSKDKYEIYPKIAVVTEKVPGYEFIPFKNWILY